MDGKKGFGLLGLLIAVFIIALFAGGGLYLFNTTPGTIRTQQEAESIIKRAQDIKKQVEKRNLNILSDLEDKNCDELVSYTLKSAEYSFLEACNKYSNKNCDKNNDCGPFPCVNNECLIKPCIKDSECPTFCGLHITPVPNFCTTIDVK